MGASRPVSSVQSTAQDSFLMSEPGDKDFQGKRIWIAEDNPGYARARANYYALSGATVETFTDPFRLADRLAAIKQGNNASPPPDLILTDWTFAPTPPKGRRGLFWDDKDVIPSGGGQVVIDAVKKSNLKIPIVVLTGDVRLEYRNFPGDVTVIPKGDPLAAADLVYENCLAIRRDGHRNKVRLAIIVEHKVSSAIPGSIFIFHQYVIYLSVRFLTSSAMTPATHGVS